MNPWDSQTIRQYSVDGIYPALTSNATGGQNRQGIVYTIEGNTIDRVSNKNGKGYAEDVSPTLNTQDRHGCCYAADIRNGALNEELSGTLQSKNGGGYSLNYQNPVVYESNGYAKYREGVGTLRASGADCGPGSENLCVYPNVTGPLMANSHSGSYTGQDAFSDMLPVVPSNNPPRKYIVRRLTPLECCRLQGFPDWWTEGCEEYPVTQYQRDTEMLRYVDPHGKIDGSDSAKYKMWGNGMALPNMLHVMIGISRAESRRTES